MQAANGSVLERAHVCSLRLSMLCCVWCGCVCSLRLSILCACLCAQEKQLLVLHRARHVCRQQSRPHLCPQHTSPPATAPLVILRLVSGVFGLERVVMRSHSCGCLRADADALASRRMRASISHPLTPTPDTVACGYASSLLPPLHTPFLLLLILVCCG